MNQLNLNANELRDSARHLRSSARGYDCIMQAAWLERLANAVEEADRLLKEYQTAYETAEAKGQNPVKKASAKEGAWQRAVNFVHKIDQEGFMPN